MYNVRIIYIITDKLAWVEGVYLFSSTLNLLLGWLQSLQHVPSRLGISEGFSFPVPEDVQVHDVSPVIDGCGRPAVNIHEQLAIEGLSSLNFGSPTEPIQGFSSVGIQGWYCHVNKEINCLFLCTV